MRYVYTKEREGGRRAVGRDESFPVVCARQTWSAHGRDAAFVPAKRNETESYCDAEVGVAGAAAAVAIAGAASTSASTVLGSLSLSLSLSVSVYVSVYVSLYVSVSVSLFLFSLSLYRLGGITESKLSACNAVKP